VDALLRRATEAGLSLSDASAERVWAYFRLLAKWNARLNLTGFTVEAGNDKAIDRLLIEPMIAASYAGHARRMADVGSGSGSPAIPFAVAAESSPVLTMVESRTRKSIFLREALRAAGVEGEVRTARFSLVAAEMPDFFDLVTVRAVRMDGPLLDSIATCLRPGGHLFWFRDFKQTTSEAPIVFEWEAPKTLIPSLGSVLSIARRRENVSRETVII
jgi:16S rRNA (guanine527-N7)-methyltransferase